MVEKEVYQTLRYLDNNDVVLCEGPYKCTKDDAWLGHGYYFWEDSMRPAKYWGKKFHDNKYIICKGTCKIDETNCFDLVGSVKHDEFLHETIKHLIEMEELTSNVSIPHVIDYLQKIGQFPFFASRAETSDAFDSTYYLTEDDFKEDIVFNAKFSKVKVRLNKVIQLCIYDLEKVNFKMIDIVFENR
jgi:hypothetical protein